MSYWCLITGATGGLGRVLALSFWNKGYSLFLHGRKKEALESLVACLLPHPHQHIFSIIADMEHPDVDKIIWEKIKKQNISIDILINNAAVHGPIGRFEDSSLADWERAMRVDLLTPIALCRHAVQDMKPRGFGRIICLSGGGATSPRPLFSAYATAKAGLVRFCENLAMELEGTRITVNSVAPGAMKTALIEEVFHKGPDAVGKHEYDVAARIMNEGGASPEAVAKLCLFLASGASDGITGKLISAKWDDYEDWPNHLEELQNGDLYTLRRITGRDRGTNWGDK